MKKNRPILAAWIVALAASALSAFAGDGITLYVRPDGNDAWSGRAAEPSRRGNDGPVATLAGARDAVRRMRLKSASLSGPVKVLFAAGTYPIAQTVVFTAADSGTAECPIAYAAEKGAKAVLTGAAAITGWQKDPSGKYWTATLPEAKRAAWNFRELFIDGRRAVRARHPNKEDFWFYVERVQEPAKAGAAVYKNRDLANWPDLRDIEIVVLRVWDFNRMRIQGVDEANRQLQLDVKPEVNGDRWQADRRYYLENSLRFLDSPGEWFLDHKRGVVYVRPFDEAAFPKAVVVAPAVDRLVRFEGQRQKGIAHLRFEGLTFACSDWNIPPEGYHGHQADVAAGAAIEADFTSFCELRKCLFTGLGRYGIWLREGCRKNIITGCEFADLGGGSVLIAQNVRGGVPKNETTGNEFTYNHVHDCGRVWLGSCGVWNGLASHTLIAHNHVHHLPYSGISVGWVWADVPSGAHDNTVEFNHIHDVVQLMGDAGGIYSLGRQNGTVIRNNVIHDIWAWHGEGVGIYTDEGSSGLLIENNLVARTIALGIQNGDNDCVARNNIIALTGRVALGTWTGNRRLWQNNIVYIDEGLLVGMELKGRQNRFERNVYWNKRDPATPLPGGGTLERWQKTGQDEGSLFADPLFVDPEGGDFRLKPQSPALKLGFKPFETPNIGPGSADPRTSKRLCELFRLQPKPASLKKPGK